MLLRKLVIIVWTPVLLVVIMLISLVHSTEAQDASEDAWVLKGPGSPISQLFTPASGALFASAPSGLFRSDDGGMTWRQVNLPDASYRVDVDPTDHTVLYAAAPGGLYESGDDAASWTLTLPTTENVRAIAVSPADHNLIYVGLARGPSASVDFRFLRSGDRGATWEQLQEFHNSLCGWDVLLLEPHPTDATQVFRTASCYGGRNTSDTLRASTDRGATWSDLFHPQVAFPARLVGGRGTLPGRFYLASNRDARAGGSSLHRTDDGHTWAEVLSYRGGGTMEGPGVPNVTIGGLTFDPATPDHVYVGVNTDPRNGGAQASDVKNSADGGATWASLGGADLGVINDLALGVDGLNLYVATDQGVWQLPLHKAAGAAAR